MNLLDGYWPWWLGAAALALVMLTHWLLLHMPMGVSGVLARLVRWRHERTVEAAARAIEADPDGFDAALIAATIEAGGEAGATEAPATAPPPSSPTRIPLAAGVTFFVAVTLGGLLGNVATGGLDLSTTLGSEFEAMFGTGWHTWLLLFFGGVLVGGGTVMAGGCTSGHGLNGCARLQPGSLLATACFMATAITISLALTRLL